ncbi:protoheme IX farnesyltransferase [Sandaracinobacter neustonicus]|uniref:Protoheme IX farnesyltransferase n=1 Tax=Sandaracinobacter neustonicus TaxID=1715348 RepID=A0A501XWR2_9SPHN|nr:heme o synthase [Sandaracinobacter neustonicus]TPE65046.1 protoheme IX farnesyltransferase [Sandaracinobacter neustonicus]
MAGNGIHIAEGGAPTGALSAADWRDYWSLLKPRVMTLVVFTGACGLFAAPGHLPPFLAFVAILCIAVGAGAAAAFNQWWEADIDAVMKRTQARPLPSGRLHADNALAFAVILSAASVMTLGFATNWVAAGWLAFSIFFYAVIYTIWLKPRTPQNIVIGGAAGAFPPIIGWAAVTGDVTTLPLLLFAIIFAWTPPHFWALALFVRIDYANAGIPMLPVTHGVRETRKQILIYSLVLAAVAVAPWALGLLGAIYGIAAALLSLIFVALAVRVAASRTENAAEMAAEKALFRYSLLYLAAIFAALVVDRGLA